MDLQEISDRLEIEAAIVRYTRGIDTGEWDLLDTVFTPDAEIDYTESGGIADTYPAVKAWLAEVLPAFFLKRMHSPAQVDVRLAGDEATATAYFHNPMPMDDGGGRRWSSSAGSTTTPSCGPRTAGAAAGCTRRSCGSAECDGGSVARWVSDCRRRKGLDSRSR